jgi:hypothetical protein
MTHNCNPLPEIEDCPVPGGCDRCSAMQELIPSVIHFDIFWLRITHAAGCPFWARVRAARNN